MKKNQLIAFIRGGGTVKDLKNMLKPELWNPFLFSSWCSEQVDNMPFDESLFPVHMQFVEAAYKFYKEACCTH